AHQRARLRGDEPRAGRLAALVERVLQLVERVHELLAVEQAEDRAPQADRRGCGAEERARLLVVEQDAPFGTAQQNPLREVRHDGGEAVAFLFQPRARLGDLRLSVALHAVERGEPGANVELVRHLPTGARPPAVRLFLSPAPAWRTVW